MRLLPEHDLDIDRDVHDQVEVRLHGAAERRRGWREADGTKAEASPKSEDAAEVGGRRRNRRLRTSALADRVTEIAAEGAIDPCLPLKASRVVAEVRQAAFRVGLQDAAQIIDSLIKIGLVARELQ